VSRLPIVCGDTDAPLDLPDTLRTEDPIPLAAKGQAGYPGWLADRQGRSLRYLRMSVTDRCDLRCQYCMPAEGVPASEREDVLSFEEIVRVVRIFARLGVETVRITGGEPLVRKNLPELIRGIREDAGITDIALTTNATALEKLAAPLVQAGLSRINVSLDSVDPETFRVMTRGGDVHRVMAGIEAALAHGIAEVKTNAVVVRGHNDRQVGDVVEWSWARGITPRFIELMPLGEGAKLGRDAVVPVAEIKATLADKLVVEGDPAYRSDRGPAGYLEARDGSGRKVGFIGAVTDNFCHRCNRVRVTARGEIRACLASPSGLSLRDLMRHNDSDDAVVEAIEEALFGKGKGHEFYVSGVDRHHAVHMSRIGG
jgi:cyclic pyranopterin phosphate synthase